MTPGGGAPDHPLLSRLLGCAAAADAFSLEADLAAMLRLESTLARAQADRGLIPRAAADAVAVACAGFRAADLGGWAEATRRDGVVVPELIRRLRAALPAGAAPHLHRGATSQDVVDTSLALRLGPLLAAYAAGLDAVAAGLDALRDRFGRRPLMARTRMRAALPITVGDRIDAWRAPLPGLAEDLAGAACAVRILHLAGPVGTLGEAEVRAAVARALALRDPGRPMHTDRGPLLRLAAWCVALTAATGKIGLDVALMAQDGIGEVRLASGGASSSMAHKRNPVAAEALVALARHAATLGAGMGHAALHEQERSGAMWTLEWLTLPPLLTSVGASLDRARDLLGSIEGMGGPED